MIEKIYAIEHALECKCYLPALALALTLPDICGQIEYPRIETALDGMDLVVAATDQRELNDQILENCKIRGIWCNVTDDPEHSDFIFPSVVRRGDLTISVCTDGASPTLTTQIKKELEEKYDESYAERLRLLKQLRRHLLKTDASSEEKKRQLRELTALTIEELQREVEKI